MQLSGSPADGPGHRALKQPLSGSHPQITGVVVSHVASDGCNTSHLTLSEEAPAAVDQEGHGLSLLLPRAENPRCRDGYCTKYNGHRGRCNLQRRPREDELLVLAARVRALKEESAIVRADRDCLQVDVTSRWCKFAQACAFLSDHVRRKRSTQNRTSTSVEEVEREIRRLVLDCLSSEPAKRHSQPAHDAPTADGTTAGAQLAAGERRSDVDVAEQSAVELVPFVLIAGDRTLPAGCQLGLRCTNNAAAHS
ncbi:hypothetical protein T492DRAFT_841317 [Pavlovales sp. CCMP2436]|nr:hypothetical protein T492DRAFT_841317 [Pavlovales sp. CCMP2436]